MARTHSDPLSEAFSELAELEYRLGDWPAAHATAMASLLTAQSAGLDHETMTSLVRLSCIEAGLGRARSCRSHAKQAVALSRAHGNTTVEARAGEAVGFLELGLGRIDAAIDALERVGELNGALGTSATDLVEAHVRRGDLSAARRTLARNGERSSSALTPALERAQAMVADDDSYELLFRRALSWSERAQQPFEWARTQLCFGERLGRARRHPEARTRLTHALERFEALGARPWADRCRCLLEDLGDSQPGASVGRSLTPRRRGGFSARLLTAIP